MIKEYFNKIQQGLSIIEKNESKHMDQAAVHLSRIIENNGIIHIFGCGHSHMIAEECFYRAGGLVYINPILDEDLMLHKNALNASLLEKDPNYGENLINNMQIKVEDAVIVVSTSGRNPVPIDIAYSAIERGILVIVITSKAYQTLPSLHHRRKHLSEIGDIVINNHVPIGDAVMTHEHVPVPFSPVSTLYSMTIMNAIISKTIENLANIKKEVPIFLSGNIENSQEYNNNLINNYKNSIPILSNLYKLQLEIPPKNERGGMSTLNWTKN